MTVGAAKTWHRFAMLGKELGDLALMRLVTFEKVNFCNLHGRISQKVIDVPEQAFFSAKMPLDTQF